MEVEAKQVVDAKADVEMKDESQEAVSETARASQDAAGKESEAS